jgi:hypothetical protein
MDGIGSAANGLVVDVPFAAVRARKPAVMLLFSAMFAALAVWRFNWEE